MNTIEVSILNYTLVLPLLPSSTVSSISLAAVQEFRSFQLKKYPQKVLYTKDSKGRILSGSLTLPLQDDLESKLEVIVEDYSDKDAIEPSDIEKLYREWQLWVLTQYKEHILQLAYREIPQLPNDQIIVLVKELSSIPIEKVQLLCLQIFRILMTKFSTKALIIDSVEQVCQIFSQTTFSEVAKAAIECFKDLSPLQWKLFEGGRYMKMLLDLHFHLSRFTNDDRSDIFSAFIKISNLIEDEELNKVVDSYHNRLKLLEDNPTQISEALVSQEDIEETLRELGNKPHKSPNKKGNITRLQSLLTSNDMKIRSYTLEKLKKQLSSCHEQYKENQRAVLSMSIQKKDISSNISSTDQLPPNPPQPVTTPSLAIDLPYLQEISDIELLIKSLFLCLKGCIKVKSTAEQVNAPLKTITEGSNISTENKQPIYSTSDMQSIAGRIITSAMNSEETDKISLVLVLETLWLLATLPDDCLPFVNNPQQSGLSQSMTKTSKVNPLTGKRLTIIQKIIMKFSRDWYRLLFTLTHIEEVLLGNEQFITIAEKSSFLFGLIVIHGMDHGWQSCALKLEPIAISRFLGNQLPSYRLYLALTYLAYLSKLPIVDESMISQPSQVQPNQTTMRSLPQTASSSINPRTPASNHTSNHNKSINLKDLLSMHKYVVLKSLWWWAMNDKANFLIKRLVFRTLSQASVISSLAHVIWKLDPIPKLLELITKCACSKHHNIHFLHQLKPKNDLHRSSHVNGKEDLHDHDEDVYDDSLSDDLSVDSYADSDTEDHESLDIVPPMQPALLDDSPLLNKALFDQDKTGQKNKIDYKLVRLILKTLNNLIQSTASQSYFTSEYREQLHHFLEELEIGEGEEAYPLILLARKDRVVRLYFSLLMMPSNQTTSK